jgi:hypothetical protein
MPHELRGLWHGRRAVLVFVRHFGRVFCYEQVVQLHREAEAFSKRGAALVIIGNGSPRQAAAFAKSLHLTIPIFVDPSRATYRALGMARGGLRETLRPATVRHLFRALRGGFRQGWIKGDPFQLGGVLVVLSDGRLAYEFASEDPGDHAPLPAIFAALEATE